MTQHDYAARFQNLLAELFMLEQADLDFGIYRIMNARRKEIESFLESDLLPQIHEELLRNQTGDRAAIERELQIALEQLRELGVPEDSSEKVRALRVKLDNAMDVPRAERDVFNHLYNFFSRYYQGGDFLSLRRYKRDVYALPYEGEEVKLHWANADQYYIKTGEYFRDYTFALGDGRRVHFKLATADTEQNNNKANGDRERRFMLASEQDFLRVENGELIIHFAYQPDGAKRKQSDINRETVARIFAALGASSVENVPDGTKAKPKAKKRIGKKGKSTEPSDETGDAEAETALKGVSTAATTLSPTLSRIDAQSGTDASNAGLTGLLMWAKALMQPIGTNGNPERTVLEKHLNDYTAKNSFDYFIHKDLNGFLRRELDFYIKNEVMLLDDIERESAPRVENYLAIIRAIRRVGLKIIEFLAQLEDFQKSLWLKKKFVVETHWCVTLDRVPKEFYAEVAANERQRAEWVRLFAIDEIKGDLHNAAYSEPLTVEFLEAQPHLVLDTSCFDRNFTERLMATDAFQDLDEQTDGVLIESENFQALTLLQARYREQIKCIYIDPPYNTSATEIIYKNSYKHSSWLSLVQNRIETARGLLASDAIICTTIDDYEVPYLSMMLIDMFGAEKHLATVTIRSKPQGRAAAAGFSVNHEYAIFMAQSESATVGRLPRDDVRSARYAGRDEKGIFAWANFRKTGGGSIPSERPKLFYPIYVSGSNIRVSEMIWDATVEAWSPISPPEDFEETIYPIDDDNQQRVWSWGWERAKEETNELTVRTVNSKIQIHRKYRPNQEGMLPGTWWDSPLYSASESGTKIIQNIFGNANSFAYPKSLFAVMDCLRASGVTERREAIAMDFFAGSGTTAHAVITLNREDDGARKFILVEMGEYFHAVTKPRVLKVIYSQDWRDGKPVSRQGSSCLVKILRLESYEDTLNNLRVHRTEQQQDLLAAHDSFREDYTLRYLFGRETTGSPSLLNLDLFENPFDYRLDINERGSSAARVSTPVDLIETFNYLLGLRVTRRRTLEDFRIVEGATLDSTRTLIIWRNTREQDNDALNLFFLAQDFGAQGFQVIYANGDHTLGMTRREAETWQPLMIEADFKRLMFEGQG